MRRGGGAEGHRVPPALRPADYGVGVGGAMLGVTRGRAGFGLPALDRPGRAMLLPRRPPGALAWRASRERHQAAADERRAAAVLLLWARVRQWQRPALVCGAVVGGRRAVRCGHGGVALAVVGRARRKVTSNGVITADAGAGLEAAVFGLRADSFVVFGFQ